MKTADCKPGTRARLIDCTPIDGTEVEVLRNSGSSVSVALVDDHPSFRAYRKGMVLNVHAYQLAEIVATKLDEVNPEDAATDAAMRDGMRELARQGGPLVAQHTPLPWIKVPQNDGSAMIAHEYQTGDQLRPKGLRLIAHVMARSKSLAEDEANTAFIVRACSSHDPLVTALLGVREELAHLVITDLAQGDHKDACFALIDRALTLAVQP